MQRSLAFFAGFESADWQYGLSMLSRKIILEEIENGDDNEPVELFKVDEHGKGSKLTLA
jgi:hypothetical protein